MLNEELNEKKETLIEGQIKVKKLKKIIETTKQTLDEDLNISKVIKMENEL